MRFQRCHVRQNLRPGWPGMSTILCIDDEPSILTLHKLLFETLGYHVVTASAGADGIRALESGHVDLVLLDYRMPDMTGAEVAEIIRRVEPDIPIVLESAYPNLPSTETRNVDAYLVKGEPTEILVHTVKGLLARAA